MAVGENHPISGPAPESQEVQDYSDERARQDNDLQAASPEGSSVYHDPRPAEEILADPEDRGINPASQEAGLRALGVNLPAQPNQAPPQAAGRHEVPKEEEDPEAWAYK